MKLHPSLLRLVRLVYRLPLAIGILALLVCFGTQVLPASAQSPAFVRVIHASPDVGTADVFVDGAKLLSSFQFGSVTGYAAVPAGSHLVQIALVGKGINAAALSQTLSVSSGVAYTVAAIGTNATGLSLQVFVDNNLVAAGTAKVRVYHLSPGTGSVDVSDGSSTVISGLSYPQASNYVNDAAGSYTFDVTSTQPSATLPLSQMLPVNTVTSIFAVGMYNGFPKLELVSAQVNGTPGLPQTGSNPNAVPTHSQPLSLWLLGVLALVVLGAGVTSVGTDVARQIRRVRSGT